MAPIGGRSRGPSPTTGAPPPPSGRASGDIRGGYGHAVPDDEDPLAAPLLHTGAGRTQRRRLPLEIAAEALGFGVEVQRVGRAPVDRPDDGRTPGGAGRNLGIR